jgi:hypothetical protein
MKREPLTRGEKILAVTSVVVVVGILGVMTWLSHINEEPKVVFPPLAQMPSPNGFDVYVQAENAITMWKPPVDPASDADIVTDPKIRAQRYGLARREAWLKANSKGFALFQQAQKLPCRTPTSRGKGPGFMPAYGKMRRLAHAKTAEANTFKLRGDWNGAARSGLDTIQMGIDVPRGGALIARLVGTACAANGKASIEDVPEHLTTAQAIAAARRLEVLMARRVPYAEALQEEKWSSIDYFLSITREKNWRNIAIESDSSYGVWLRSRTISKTRIVRNIERTIDEGVADLQKPYSAPMLEDEEDNSENEEIFSFFTPSSGRLRFTQTRENVGLDLLLLRFALRAYTLDNGAPPQRLEQLAPNYLKAIPRDTFADGAPYHYQQQGKSYKLWSVGPDMKNDGGTPIPPRNPLQKGGAWEQASILPESKGDWVAGKNR